MYIFIGITCAQLSNPANGSVMFNGVINPNGSWVFGAEAVYSCNAGFSLVGSSMRTCTGDGSSATGNFDDIAPTCEREFI